MAEQPPSMAVAPPDAPDAHHLSSASAAGAVPPPDKPQKKRRRPALACEQCRRRKIRCDRNVPCGHCVRTRQVGSCSYVPTHIPASWAKKQQQQQQQQQPLPPLSASASTQVSVERRPSPPFILPATQSGSTNTVSSEDAEFFHPYEKIVTVKGSSSAPSSTPASEVEGSPNVGWLVSKIHHLEEKLSRVSVEADESVTDHVSPNDTDTSAPIKGTVSKTRYFGRSHWMNGATLLPLEMGLLTKAEVGKGDLAHVFGKCKALGRKIKENRLKPLSTLELGRNIPSREVADQLVENYLRTFEGVLRILHVPTFRAEYERYWQQRQAASDFFIIQLQLCMALGAVLYDETFSMRPLATQWVYEAQLWLMLPPEKSRMTIAGIQIMCLVTLARNVCSVGQDLVWVTTGGLVRKAMFMGMHRDPRHLADMTVYRAEMRRRLWATILELNLQSSFDAGGPPLMSSADHDVQPPANLDDDQLTDELDRLRTIKNPPEAITQMSVPLELIKTMPLRLTLLRHANDFRADDNYDETLRYNSELTKACRSLSQTMTILIKNQQGKPNPKATAFHSSLTELLVYRCFHTLHQPFIGKSLLDPKYYFSRKMYLDGALKITHVCGLSGMRRAEGPANHAAAESDFNRVVVNGSGFLRNITVQCSPSIVQELIHSGDSTTSFGLGYLPAVHDYDLRTTLDAYLMWTLRRIRSGETNTKGHCFAAAGMKHIDGLMAGKDMKAIEADILEGATEAGMRAFDALKEVAAREGVNADDVQEKPTPEMGVMSDDMPMDFLGDWDWDEMNGLLWGSPKPFADAPPPIFG